MTHKLQQKVLYHKYGQCLKNKDHYSAIVNNYKHRMESLSSQILDSMNIGESIRLQTNFVIEKQVKNIGWSKNRVLKALGFYFMANESKGDEKDATEKASKMVRELETCMKSISHTEYKINVRKLNVRNVKKKRRGNFDNGLNFTLNE